MSTHPSSNPCLTTSSSPLSAQNDHKTNFANSIFANAFWNSPASLALPYPKNPSWCDIPSPQHQTRSLHSTPQTTMTFRKKTGLIHIQHTFPSKFLTIPSQSPPMIQNFCLTLKKEREIFNQLIVSNFLSFPTNKQALNNMPHK